MELINSRIDTDRINEEKIKLGSWLNCLSVTRFSNLRLDEVNQMEWEKIILILFWNARVSLLNLKFPQAPTMTNILFEDSKSKNTVRQNFNEKILNQNDLLIKILLKCSDYENFEVKMIQHKIYSFDEIKIIKPPNVLSLIPTFHIVPDFIFPDKPVG